MLTPSLTCGPIPTRGEANKPMDQYASVDQYANGEHILKLQRGDLNP